MADYSLGTATGKIVIDYDGKGVQQAAAGAKQIENSHDKAGAAVAKVGNVAGIAGLAVAAGIGLAVKTAADFEQGLSNIQAVSGNTAAQMELVRSKALQIGKDTTFSATEAASAIEELSKAGISTTDILNGAADATVSLAAATGVDMPTAATIASNAMNQFQLSAKQMPHIVDILAGAANASAIDIRDLGESMKYVGPVAHGLGVSIEDTSTALALLGNQGIKGSQAGTSLRSILTNLTPTTKKASAAFKDLGLITKDGANVFYDAQGKVKPLDQVIGILHNSMKGLTAQEQATFAKKAFGLESMPAVIALASNTTGSFDKMAASIAKVKAADVAKTRMDNLMGSIEQLKGSLETLGINMGTVFLPVIRQIADGLNTLVGAFLNLSPSAQGTIAIVASVGAALLLLLAVFVKVVQGAQAVKVAMIAVNGTFLTNPVFLIIAALIALGAALVILYQRSETFRNIVNAAWSGIQAVVGAVVGWITGTAVPAIVSAWNAVSSAATTLWGLITTAWNAIVTAVTTAYAAITAGTSAVGAFMSSVWTTITGAIMAAWNGIVAFFSAIWSAISTVFVSAGSFIMSILMTSLSGWLMVITGGMNLIISFWRGVWNLFGPLVMAVFNLIVAILRLNMAIILFIIGAIVRGALVVWNTLRAGTIAVWNAIRAAVTVAVNAVRSVVTAVIGAIRPYVTTVWNAIRSVTTAVWNAIRSVVTSVVNAIRSVVTSVFNAIRSVVTSVMNSIRSVVTSVWNSIRSVVTSVVNSIKSVITSGFNAAKNAAVSAFNSMKSAVSSAIHGVLSVIQSVVGSIKGVFAGAGGWLISAGRSIIEGLVNGISSAIGKVTSILNSVTNLIPDWKGPKERDEKLLTENGQLIMGGLITGIEDQLGPLKRTLEGVTFAIPSTIGTDIVAAGAIPGQRTAAENVQPVTRSGPNVELNVYNPVAEATSVTTTKAMTRMAQLGVFGG